MTEFQKEVLNLIDEGYAVSEISKKLNRSKSSVSSVIKRFNVKPKKNLNSNELDHNYFDNIDSEDKAYFLGFLIADGTISSGSHRSEGRIGFLIQEEDSYILEKLKEKLRSKNQIYRRENHKGALNRKIQASFRWTSKHMSQLLKSKYGIISNKTQNIDFEFPLETIPKEYIGDFIRGFIDGDGSFESHEGTFTPSIVGTSKKWLCQIGDIVSAETELNYSITEIKGKTCNYYTLRWSANRVNKLEKITKLYEFLYKTATIYLTRKKEKIVRYLEYRANLGN